MRLGESECTHIRRYHSGNVSSGPLQTVTCFPVTELVAGLEKVGQAGGRDGENSFERP